MNADSTWWLAFWLTITVTVVACLLVLAAERVAVWRDGRREDGAQVDVEDIDDEWRRLREGYWAYWDAADDKAEDELDRQIRDGLSDWGGDVA